MRISKIYFPTVTVVRIAMEEEGYKPWYLSQTPGGSFYNIEGLKTNRRFWVKALKEAKAKGARIESRTF